MTEDSWRHVVDWPTLRHGGSIALEADESVRQQITSLLDLEGLESLTAQFEYRPWLDGVEIEGNIEGLAHRLCGLTLESLKEKVEAPFSVRVVPEGSPHTPILADEVERSLNSEDPPDVAPMEGVDLGAYTVEAFGLGLEPFPRKHDAIFDVADHDPDESPFAKLIALKKTY